MPGGLVSIIIPVWNLWHMTEACLRSLAEHTAGADIEVLVVDNHSTDETETRLNILGKALFGPAFRSLRLPENRGFARACNAGAAAAAGELLFFLNNDTTATPGWLPPLRQALAAPSAGAVGPLLLYPDGTIQHCGICVSPFQGVGHLYEHLPGNFPAARAPHALQAITGAAMLVRAEVFHQCGRFHEGYANGFEDLDFCCTLRDLGLTVGVEARSVIRHHASQTPGRFDHDPANGQVFLRRHGRKLVPDMHRLAARDGYRLRLGPTLVDWLEVPEEKHQVFQAAVTSAGFDETLCGRLLRREPLWRRGWLLLAEHLERDGRPWEALELLKSRAWQYPEASLRDAMVRLCAEMGEQDEALAILEDCCTLDRLGESAARVLAALEDARARNDAALAALLEDWLARYAPA